MMYIIVESYINEIVASRLMDKHTKDVLCTRKEEENMLYEKKKHEAIIVRFLFCIRSNFVVEPVGVQLVGVEWMVLDD